MEPIAGFPAETAASPPPAIDLPGARPLRRPAHERFARARSLLAPLVEAYREAGLGGDNYVTDRGNAAKLDRRQDIRNRVAYLTRQPEEQLKAKREKLEAFLWAAHETNYAEFWETVEEPIRDGDGEVVYDSDGKLVMRKVERIRPFKELSVDQQRMIESLKFTEKGNPILSLYSRMQANIELRKLLGIGAVDRDAREDEFGRMDDRELFATIAREAKDLGIDVEFTFRANGAAA